MVAVLGSYFPMIDASEMESNLATSQGPYLSLAYLNPAIAPFWVSIGRSRNLQVASISRDSSQDDTSSGV